METLKRVKLTKESIFYASGYVVGNTPSMYEYKSNFNTGISLPFPDLPNTRLRVSHYKGFWSHDFPYNQLCDLVFLNSKIKKWKP